jgi:hypothetical protein
MPGAGIRRAPAGKTIMSSHRCVAFRTSILTVGQDPAGRWLVQDDAGLIEGLFRTRETALGFARSERDIHSATIAISAAPLTARLLH